MPSSSVSADDVYWSLATITTGYGLEFTARQADRFLRRPLGLLPGTRVHVPWLGLRRVERVAARLVRESMWPVIHIDDRLGPRTRLLGHVLATLEDVGVSDIVRVCGPSTRIGDLTAFLDHVARRPRICGIGLVPETGANPTARGRRWLAQVLDLMKSLVRERSLDAYLITPRKSGPNAVEWERYARECGNRLPVRVGLSASVTTGVPRLRRPSGGITVPLPAMTRSRRTRLLLAALLEAATAAVTDDESLIEGVHLYPCRGEPRSAPWPDLLTQGRFVVEQDDLYGYRIELVT